MTRKPKPQTSTNRREEVRVPANGEICYLPTRASRAWKFKSARLLDCSANGIGIECDEPMVANDDFIVKLHIGGKVRLAVYRVQNVLPCEQGYRVGGEFIGLLIDPDDVDHATIVEALSGVHVEGEKISAN